MKVSTTWLNKRLSRTISNDDIVVALESAGVEVEQISSTVSIDSLIVVGTIKKCVQHPNADRLNITEVEIDASTSLTIICGASNVRVGLKVAVAQVGSVLPDGELIQKTKLRGEFSNGMLCSGKELGINDDHDGLLELDDLAEIGSRLADIYPADGILDIKTPANRFDLQSIIGLAREIAAFTGVDLVTNELDTPVLSKRSGPKVTVEVEPSIVGRYMLASIRLEKPNITLSRTMLALLRNSGIRTISPIVDSSNISMLENGQPLHAYDSDKVSGDIYVRYAKPDETLITLDGTERKLTVDDLVIADSKGPIGLAGIMGGLRTEVDKNTTKIFLEAATFNGATIRKMAKRHNLRSEASARFERSLPVTLAPIALSYAINLLNYSLGLTIDGITDELRVWPWVQRIGIKLSTINNLLGINLSYNDVIEALDKIQIKANIFDISEEAKSHLGKPYVWGASYKKNLADAFDCSYLTDYLYSLIGMKIGYTSLAQYERGIKVDDKNLRPGDIVFYEGKASESTDEYDLKSIAGNTQEHSIVGHYYLWDDDQNKYIKTLAKSKHLVGHNGVYIGNGKVVHAAAYEFTDNKWNKLKNPKVIETDLSSFTANPGYLGARRFDDYLDDYISIPEVPWWRPDLKMAEDVIEEIVRVIGYESIPAKLPEWRPKDVEFDHSRSLIRRITNILYGSGMFEVITYSFVSESQIRDLGQEPKDFLKLKNPLSIEQAYLRKSPLPSHLMALSKNNKYSNEIGIYEITGIFEPKSKGELPNEPKVLSYMIRSPKNALFLVKGILDKISLDLNIDLKIDSTVDNRFEAGRCAAIRIGDVTIGVIGQLKSSLTLKNKLTGEVAYCEIKIDLLLKSAHTKKYTPINRFPSAKRDISLIIDEGISWNDIFDVAMIDNLAKVSFLSDFRGDGIPEHKKSVAFRLEMSTDDHTLTDSEIESRIGRIISRLETKFNAKLRL